MQAPWGQGPHQTCSSLCPQYLCLEYTYQILSNFTYLKNPSMSLLLNIYKYNTDLKKIVTDVIYINSSHGGRHISYFILFSMF